MAETRATPPAMLPASTAVDGVLPEPSEISCVPSAAAPLRPGVEGVSGVWLSWGGTGVGTGSCGWSPALFTFTGGVVGAALLSVGVFSGVVCDCGGVCGVSGDSAEDRGIGSCRSCVEACIGGDDVVGSLGDDMSCAWTEACSTASPPCACARELLDTSDAESTLGEELAVLAAAPVSACTSMSDVAAGLAAVTASSPSSSSFPAKTGGDTAAASVDVAAAADGASAFDVGASSPASDFGTAVHCLPFSVVRKAPSGRSWSDMESGLEKLRREREHTRRVSVPSLSPMPKGYVFASPVAKRMIHKK